MPYMYGPPVILTSREIDQVRTWIACGALDGDGGCPAEAGSDAGDAGGADAADAVSNDAVSNDAVTDGAPSD
jgi:hypothetical protein